MGHNTKKKKTKQQDFKAILQCQNRQQKQFFKTNQSEDIKDKGKEVDGVNIWSHFCFPEEMILTLIVALWVFVECGGGGG